VSRKIYTKSKDEYHVDTIDEIFRYKPVSEELLSDETSEESS